MRSLWKAFTSSAGRPAFEMLLCLGPSLPGCSIVSNVRENGFAGTLLSTLAALSLGDSESELSKDSPCIVVGVVGSLNMSSPTVELESGMDDEEGDGGGGDCTRTFLEVFFSTSGLEMFEASCRGPDC